MFHVFHSQEERRAYGGSCFIEFQFCKLPLQTDKKVILNCRTHWLNDSLYVHGDDQGEFFQEYSQIFNCGIYANFQTGVVDCWGINYYSPETIEPIIQKIQQNQPKNNQLLLDWLNTAKQYNGFYIFGV